MTILLESNFAGKRQNLVVLPGQNAKVGSSAWADLSIDEDASMADEHFVVEHSVEPQVRAILNSQLEVAGRTADHFPVADGICFQAGNTRFELRVNFSRVQTPKNEDCSAQELPEEDNGHLLLSQSLLDKLKLTSTCQEKLASGSGLSIVDRLNSAQETADLCDCTKLIASLLTREKAAGIVASYLSQVGSPLTNEVQQAVQDWRSDPTEDSRKKAAVLVAKHTAQDIEYWCLRAIQWSDGSLGATDGPEVKPPAHLFAIAMAVAIQLSAVGSPCTPERRISEFQSVVNNHLVDAELQSTIFVNHDDREQDKNSPSSRVHPQSETD